jgi:hypothetical protein
MNGAAGTSGAAGTNCAVLEGHTARIDAYHDGYKTRLIWALPSIRKTRTCVRPYPADFSGIWAVMPAVMPCGDPVVWKLALLCGVPARRERWLVVS